MATPKDVFLETLLIDGSNRLKAELAPALTGASLARSSDGVSTLTLEADDSRRHFIRSTIIQQRITAQIVTEGEETRSFELVQVKKSGYGFTLIMEDLAVAEMRRRTDPRKFAAGSVTRVQAAKLLLDEIGWIPMIVAPNDQKPIQVVLARGQLSAVPTDKASTTTASGPDANYFSGGGSSASAAPAVKQTQVAEEDREDTWTAIKRWFAEINWTCFVDSGRLYVGPDSAYIAGEPVYKLAEDNPALTSPITWDWDVGKPMATADFQVSIERYAAAPGTCIELLDQGPASGKWFVSETNRNLFSYLTDISLKTPTPELPEPVAPPVDSDMAASGPEDDYFAGLLSKLNETLGKTGEGAAASDSAKWRWPVNGSHKVTSGFGSRSSPTAGASSNHKGIDIQASTGQGVFAVRSGIVSFAGVQNGYGNTVVITHSDGPGSGQTESLYAHLSAISVKRGVAVFQGQLVGLAGATGNVTGPHLHLELHVGVNGTPIDPLPVLLGSRNL